MEVRFLPPERDPPRIARGPFASVAGIPEHGDPSTSGRAVGREHEERPNARRGGARGRQGQTAEVLEAQGPASHLRPAGAVARAAGRRRHPSEQDRRGRRARRRRRPRGGHVLGTEARAGLRRADRAAGNRACGAGRGAGGGPRAGRAGGRGRLRPGDRGRSEATARCASTGQGCGRDLRDRARRAGRLRARGARTGQAGRDRGGHRRARRAPRQQPGLAAHHGVPSRRPVPRVAGRGSREPQGRVLPERGAPDPHGQGRARVGRPRRHRRDVRRELARRAGRRRARGPRADQRRPSGQRRHDGRPRRDLHRRRRPDRPGHGDPPDDVPGGRDGGREGRVDRPFHADRRLHRRRPERGDVRGGPRLDDRQGRPRGAVRADATRHGPGGPVHGGGLRRPEERHGRPSAPRSRTSPTSGTRIWART